MQRLLNHGTVMEIHMEINYYFLGYYYRFSHGLRNLYNYSSKLLAENSLSFEL